MEAVYFEAPGSGGSRSPEPDHSSDRPGHEPIVNAPWPVVAITLSIVVLYFLQTRFPFVVDTLSFSPDRLLAGHYEGLITSQFLHGGWSHALMNAAFVLAFGAPVSRYFGPRGSGASVFFLFYVLCGVLACLGFAALHWGQEAPMVGASGAASGLMGAAARLIGGQGRPGRLLSQAVVSMGGAWVLINVIMAFAGGLLIPGAGEAGVAWEAHLAGFAAGALLLPAFGWLAGRR